MHKESSQLRHREPSETVAGAEQAQQVKSVEFGSVEEVLRKDREQTELPPMLVGRVAEAIRREPTELGTWWNRWFGSGRKRPRQ